MTTGKEVRELRSRYTADEWRRMAVAVVPLAVEPPKAGGLDTPGGLTIRQQIIDELAVDPDVAVPFIMRHAEAYKGSEAWAVALMEELGYPDAESLTADGLELVFKSYLEDLFDDVLTATEWQQKALADDEKPKAKA